MSTAPVSERACSSLQIRRNSAEQGDDGLELRLGDAQLLLVDVKECHAELGVLVALRVLEGELDLRRVQTYRLLLAIQRLCLGYNTNNILCHRAIPDIEKLFSLS